MVRYEKKRRVFVVREEIDEKTADIQARSSMARVMEVNAELKEKQKWSEEKIHLDNARKLRGIYFIDPEDKEFKETIKNARKKLETPVAHAMPCKIMKNCGSGGSDKNKTKLACILEASALLFCTQTDSCASSHEDTRSKRQQWVKNGRNWKRFRRGT